MSGEGAKRRWSVAVGGGVLALLVLLPLFRAPPPPPPTAPQVKPSVQLDTSPELREEAAFFDPTPLFLPTAWNAGGNAIPAGARREPGGAFPGYPPKLTYAETELQLALPSVVAEPKTPAEAFDAGRPSPTYWGFGQTDWVARPLAARGAFVEVLKAGNGQRMMTLPIANAKPPTETPWQPLQFLVAIDAAGVVGPPVLTESSRVAAVDGYFQNFIVETLHVGERLGPGFYRVCIGP